MSMINNYIEEYENALFRTAVNETAKLESSRLMKEAQEFVETNNVEYDTDMIQKQINKAFRSAKIKKASKTALKFAKRAAAILIVFAVIGFAYIMSVDAARKQNTRFLMSFNPEYTKLELENINNESNYFIDFNRNFVPGYIPSGFVLKSMSIDEGGVDLYYENEDGLGIRFSADPQSTIIKIDTENTDKTAIIDVSGTQGLMTSKSGLVTIAWSKYDCLFLLQSHLSEEETLKIAESVQPYR